MGGRRTIVLTAALAATLAGCGGKEGPGTSRGGAPLGTPTRPVPAGIPPAAATPGAAVSPGTVAPTAGSPLGTAGARPVLATPKDVEAAQSSPLDRAAALGPAAPSPGEVGGKAAAQRSAAPDGYVSPGAPSDDEIAAELKQMDAVVKQAEKRAGAAGPTSSLELTAKGNARTPANAPPAVAGIIAAANQIARFPYVYGGGHRSFIDKAYDCSGSVSYVLAGAGLLNAPLDSGQLSRVGAKGPGKWVTIYANAGHTFMVIAGVRYDTSGRSGPRGTRWQAAPRQAGGFKVRHPPGL